MSANTETYSTRGTNNSSSFDGSDSPFSNKNTIIIILLVLLILSLIGINLLNLTHPIVVAISDLLSMIGFTTGSLIKGSADLVANTADVGIDIAKGTTHSIGDLLINSNRPGVDPSKQKSLTEMVGIPKFNYASASPEPVQSSEPTVTPISTQKPKAGWCYVGDFAGARGCVEVSEQDKCMSGQIFTNQKECLKIPAK
jgi:hypothetical protein